MNPWGRFTVRGSDVLEQIITSLLQEISEICKRVIPSQNCRAAVLIGGYGRGEGGVEIIHGVEFLHNNLDFIIFTESLDESAQMDIKKDINALLQEVCNRYEIGIDISLIDAKKLKNSPCLVMWYDMRHGHKLLYGDENFLPSLKRFSLENILPADIRNLLVNRGTLLLINEMLLDRGNLSKDEKKLFIKHVMKCIIGYGDALLFFLGDYHWSYQEKQKRMQSRDDISAEFKNLYNQAMEFRFQPAYNQFMKQDFNSWLISLRGILEPVHLRCERIRLRRPNLTWETYMPCAFRHELFDQFFSLRQWAKKFLNFLSPATIRIKGDIFTKTGFLFSGKRGQLSILFPNIAYHLKDPKYYGGDAGTREAFAKSLKADRKSYLNQWAFFGDENFSYVLKKLKMTLE